MISKAYTLLWSKMKPAIKPLPNDLQCSHWLMGGCTQGPLCFIILYCYSMSSDAKFLSILAHFLCNSHVVNHRQGFDESDYLFNAWNLLDLLIFTGPFTYMSFNKKRITLINVYRCFSPHALLNTWGWFTPYALVNTWGVNHPHVLTNTWG